MEGRTAPGEGPGGQRARLQAEGGSRCTTGSQLPLRPPGLTLTAPLRTRLGAFMADVTLGLQFLLPVRVLVSVSGSAFPKILRVAG